MKKALMILILLVAATSCGGSGSAIAPSVDSETIVPIRTVEFWNDPMPDEWKADGSLMSHDDLCYYFAAHLTTEWYDGDTGHPYFCNLFELLHTYLLDHYPLAYQLVRWYERNRFDIPNQLDITMPC